MAFPAASGVSAAPEQVTGEQVRAAILRAVAYLRGGQKPDGTWPDYAHEGGVTALACHALLQAGVSPDDPAVAAGLRAIVKVENRHTYVVALKAMALASADPKRYKAEIQTCADWLVEMQHATGGWGYGTPPDEAPALAGQGLYRVKSEAQIRCAYERTDASNTQFAILGLSEAEHAGAHVPLEAWQKAERLLRTTQLPNGGWGYVYQTADPDDAYGSVTAAALAGLYLCGDRLSPAEPARVTAERAAAIERGTAWITQNYTLNGNPNHGLAWYYFWLYSLERVGVASGRRTFGDHDWFREGLDLLVKGQQLDGSWTPRLYQNALALLFLTKGFRPLLVQRLEWQGGWREDPRDLDHLVRYLGTRVGGQAVAWQTVRSDASVQDLLAAPILHVSGRGPLRMLGATLLGLKPYVEQGGLVLFDAQGGDETFTASVRRLAGELFDGATFEPLPPNHPIYTARYPVAPAGLETLNLGCRASVLLAPKGLSDGWAASDPDRASDALRLGENLALYATGNEALPDRLHEATLLAVPRQKSVPRDALRIGQIQHGGDWRPRPLALPRLLAELSEKFGASVYDQPAPLRLGRSDDAELLRDRRALPILYLVGHYSFTLDEKERAALKDYLDRGGFLWAEACCGRKAFDSSFRALVVEMYPGARLEKLPLDHPIYSGRIGYKIDRVAYSPAVRAETPDLQTPVLYGLQRGGSLVVVYSPYGIGVGLDGMRVWGARCLEPDDARRLAADIVLYGLSEP